MGNPLGPIIWLEKSRILGSKLFSFCVIAYAFFAFFFVDPFFADFSSSVLEFERTYLDIKTYTFFINPSFLLSHILSLIFARSIFILEVSFSISIGEGSGPIGNILFLPMYIASFYLLNGRKAAILFILCPSFFTKLRNT